MTNYTPLARNLYAVARGAMLRGRGMRISPPFTDFDRLPHDEQGAWVAVAEHVAKNRHRYLLNEWGAA